jgi:hypothetical protein
MDVLSRQSARFLAQERLIKPPQQPNASSLVFIECTLAVVPLAATGLLRSVIRLQRVDLGFRADHLVLENVGLHGDKYNDARIRAFVDEAIHRVEILPGRPVRRRVAAGRL